MYDAVIQAGYMKHAELAAKLSDWTRRQAHPLRILDLGCGDAWLASNAFRDANVEQYRGVDVAESAVERARDHIAIWPGRAEVECDNLARFLRRLPDESANVVLASYSLHHFLDPQKIELLHECRRVLVPAGTFFWIDAVRNDDENRDNYIDRLTSSMKRHWNALTPEQCDLACNHIRESDFPESAAWIYDQVRQAGFQLESTILRDEFFDGWEFTKA
jgi:ubiquinone/menaquinone biosynthesis C-methylase UbiE